MKKYHSVDILFVFILFAVFTALSVLLVLIGSDIYSGIVQSSEENAKIRTTVSYIANKTRANDEKGGISLEEIDGETVLVFRQEIEETVYKNMIYYYDGQLWEAFIRDGQEFDFSYGEVLAAAKDFSIEFKEDAYVLTLGITDMEGGRQVLDLALRSAPQSIDEVYR